MVIRQHGRDVRRNVLMVLIASVAILAAGAWHVERRGGWTTWRSLTPVLDATTPRAQGSFRLIEVQVAGTPGTDAAMRNRAAQRAGGLGIRLSTPWVPERRWGDLGYPRDSFRAAARTSDGRTLDLPWCVEGSGAGRRLFVEIPAAYPPESRYVDVSVRDRTGRGGRWRLTRLTQLRRTDSKPFVMTRETRLHGITLAARATRGGIPWTAWQVAAAGSPEGPNQWEMMTSGLEYEWEPYGSLSEYSGVASLTASVNGAVAPNHPTVLAYNDYTSQAAFSDAVRIKAGLREYDTHTETVTLRNLRIDSRAAERVVVSPLTPPTLWLERPLRIFTPSGLGITLPPQGVQEGQTSAPFRAKGLGLFFHLSPAADTLLMPRSPLFRRHRLPIRLRIDVAPPFRLIESRALGPRHYFTLACDTPPGEPPPDSLTLVVQQRTDLRVVPVTLTVPIEPPGNPTAAVRAVATPAPPR